MIILLLKKKKLLRLIKYKRLKSFYFMFNYKIGILFLHKNILANYMVFD